MVLWYAETLACIVAATCAVGTRGESVHEAARRCSEEFVLLVLWFSLSIISSSWSI